MNILVNLVGVALIILTTWFFLFKKEGPAVKVNKKIRVTVDGGYHPDVLEVPVGVTTTLEFFRKDPTSCLEEVIFPDFHIRQFLPLNQSVAVSLTPKEKGEYSFHCGMSMFFGKLKVV